MAILLKGKPVADVICDDIKNEVELLNEKNIKPKLAIVRVGSNPDDMAYERGALKRCSSVGVETEVIGLPEDVSQEEYIRLLEWLNTDNSVHGILTLRPLPSQIDENVIKDIIKPEKDVDGFNPINFSKIAVGDSTGFAPCTPSAVIELLKYSGITIKGRHIAILGRSMVVGKPLSMMLLNEDATITLCHSKTDMLESITQGVDIVITAIGRAKAITMAYVKPGSIVIDVGINVDENGKLCGDVDFEDVNGLVAALSTVPGGVGSITTSILVKHTVEACKLQNK